LIHLFIPPEIGSFTHAPGVPDAVDGALMLSKDVWKLTVILYHVCKK